MTSPAGPWTAVRHGRRWTVENVLDDSKKHPLYDTHDLAQAEADKHNQQYTHAHTPRPPQPDQPDLFSHQEAT